MTYSFWFGFTDWWRGGGSREVLDEAVVVASVYVSRLHLGTPAFELAI